MLKVTKHYTAGHLTAAADGQLDAVYGSGSEALLKGHLERCKRCRKLSTEVERLRDFVGHCFAAADSRQSRR
jgi:predicted anti-sigma-YlaC factor YlaD